MQEFIKALSWTFVHSLWQGLVAALLAAIIIGLTRRTSARVRYNFLGLVMILFLAGAVITFIVQWNALTKAGFVNSLTTGKEGLLASNHTALMDNFIAWVNTNSDYLILGWTFCFLFSCLRLITGLAAVNRLRYYKTKPVSEEWKAKLRELQSVMGIRRSIGFFQSELVKIPLALGHLKPVILVPLGLLANLPPEQVETILLHELAHIRRRDFLVNLLQHIVEAIFFFNPALRWLSSLLREEREACCDDIVMASCNQQTNYFNALVSFQEYSMHQPAYAMGIGSKRQYLLNRVKRMITNKNKGISLCEKLALFAGVILFSAFNFVTGEKPAAVKHVLMFERPVLQHAITVPAKGETENNTIYNRAKIDTIPVKNNIGKKVEKNKTEKPGKNDKAVSPGIVIEYDEPIHYPPPVKSMEQKKSKEEADEALKEIIKLKDEIGGKKEVIGLKKELLRNKDGAEKNKIQGEIDKERHAVDQKRDELERIRAKWEALKKQTQKDAKPEKIEAKIVKNPNGWSPRKADGKGDGKGKGNDRGDGKGAGWEPSKKINSKPDKLFNLKIKNSLDYKQELDYKMNLRVKDPRTAPKTPTGPVKSKAPETPKKKVSLGP